MNATALPDLAAVHLPIPSAQKLPRPVVQWRHYRVEVSGLDHAREHVHGRDHDLGPR
jgi:hypothetical protein